jgi:single-stranded-DNA-specific exonuclease
MKKIIPRLIDARALAALPDDLPLLLRRIYAARQVSDRAQLEQGLDRLHPTLALSGMTAAVALLQEALAQDWRIMIVADFDADGATSCALAVRALRALGARDVRYLVPNRFEYGYGLTPEIVAVAAQQAPALIITVDNGVSSIEGVAAAQQHGIRVLVTDHHLAGATLPAADAIVNPNLPGDAFPSKNLAGVGVIFYVMLALRARLREIGWFTARGITEPNFAVLLDLVALGTVADVVPLDHNNRILVEQGLRRIRAGQCCPGILALLEAGGRTPERLAASDLGFAVAPRLNAAGRLEDMAQGIECLLSDELGTARQMAQRLDELNRERRGIEADMQEQALVAIAQLRLSDDCMDAGGRATQGAVAEDSTLPTGLCLYDDNWHQGVIGILAGRIKDRLHRPVIAFAPAGDGELKGSARSVPGFHIRDALDAVATRHPGLISKFGGHAMAAGLSLKRENFANFSAAFAAEVSRHLNDDDLHAVIHSDGELAAEELSLENAELLRASGPWGQGFPEPVFHGEFEVLSRRVVGERHLKFTVRRDNVSRPLDAIAFNAVESGVPEDCQRLLLAYRLDVNEYRGLRTVQLVVEHLEPVA